MTKEEILHLGTLSRIRIPENEVETFHREIESILEYVSAVDKLVDAGDLEKVPGPVHNVFRDDVVTNPSGAYTKDIVDSFPKKRGNYLEVKKILNPDS